MDSEVILIHFRCTLAISECTCMFSRVTNAVQKQDSDEGLQRGILYYDWESRKGFSSYKTRMLLFAVEFAGELLGFNR